MNSKKYENQLLERRRLFSTKHISKIAILFYIPETEVEKYNNWSDGFVKGIKLLKPQYSINWVNLFDTKPNKKELESYDFIIVKSCWNWIVDKYVRSFDNLDVPLGIMVSCSLPPPHIKALMKYDVVWYETMTYKTHVANHPYVFHAFGIDSDIFYPRGLSKTIDVLSIGAFKKYKRFEKINSLSGRKVIIGNNKTSESKEIINTLKDVEVISYVSQEEMAIIINKSRLVYIPAGPQGGGERAVLEARACGVEVKVEPDNHKLLELCKGSIWNQETIKRGILDGINSLKTS